MCNDHCYVMSTDVKNAYFGGCCCWIASTDEMKMERVDERWKSKGRGPRQEQRLRARESKSTCKVGRLGNWKTLQELGYQERYCPHIPRGQTRGMCGTAEEVGHRVVSGMAVGAPCGQRHGSRGTVWSSAQATEWW